MATVTTPSGDVLEGVSGDALDYYRGLANVGQDYRVVDDEAEVAAVFPQVYEHGERVELPGEPEHVVQLPEGQAFQTDGTEHESDGSSPLPDATGQLIDTATGLPVDPPSTSLDLPSGDEHQ